MTQRQRPRTATLLREASFKGAEGLRAPLNDLFQRLQDRLSALEQRPRFELLGPQLAELPINVFSTPSSAVDFALPEDFTPSQIFIVSLVDPNATGVTTINPMGLEFEVVSDSANGAYFVRVRRITTTTTAGRYLLTLGALE